MEVTLKSLFESSNHKFKLNLMAGKGGLDNIISWVHLIEDVSTTDFIRGNELIITTGLGYQSESWLEVFITDLIDKNAKGLIINIGNYIPKIPDSIIKYCESRNFPLFSMPWEIHLVDIMQEYSNKILQAERIEIDESEMMIKALLDLSPREVYQLYFDEHGFNLTGKYSICLIQYDGGEKTDERAIVQKQMRISLSNRLRKNYRKFSLLHYHDQIIIVLQDVQDEQKRKIAKDFKEILTTKYVEQKCFLVMGPTVEGLTMLHKSYKRSQAAMRFCQIGSEGICHYDDLGVEKILLEIEDQELLKQICEERLGKLMAYDKAHNTDYMSILRLYIFNDCSVHAVAEKSYTHRNTINYRMNKIKEIIPFDLTDATSRLQYQVAYYIKDLLF